MDLFILILVTVPFLIWSIPLIMGAISFKTWKRMKDTPTIKVVDAEPGIVEIIGTTRSIPGRSVVSPLTGTECINYRIRVFVIDSHRDSRGHTRETERTIWRDGIDSDFLIGDDSGSIIVHAPKKVEAVQTVHRESQGSSKDLSTRALELCRANDIPLKGPFGILDRGLHFEEKVLKEGIPLYLLGEAKEIPQDPSVRKMARTSPYTIAEDGKMVISQGTEEDASSGKLKWSIVLFSLSAAAFIGHVLWIWFVLSWS